MTDGGNWRADGSGRLSILSDLSSVVVRLSGGLNGGVERGGVERVGGGGADKR